MGKKMYILIRNFSNEIFTSEQVLTITDDEAFVIECEEKAKLEQSEYENLTYYIREVETDTYYPDGI